MKVVHCLINRQMLTFAAPDEVVVGETVFVVETPQGYIVASAASEDLSVDHTAFCPIVSILDLDDYCTRKQAVVTKSQLQAEIGRTIQSLLNGLTVSELSERFPEIQSMVNQLSDLPLDPKETVNARLA